ncbi:aldo/keto reductase [Bacillus amyloliquefaciens]|uniref:aldo/keto reductase n=1 Tax=Bacillus amyloliquefaciens TaxID=1390 RepID=UPI002FF9ED40
MKDRTIGSMRVSAMGLGCMGMSEYYGSQSEEESISTLHHAVHLGVNLFDTADQYGLGANEELVGKALAPFRKELYLATKFGYVRSEKGEFIEINGRPDYVKKACDASLKRLGTDYIDLYYLHRIDPRVPIEETVGAMKELIDEGKVRFIGLSEASAETIRRAVRIHPIAALQSEYSLWSREAEEHVLPACRELGISFVPYSPLGRGFLSGKMTSAEQLDADDYRRRTPRFQGDNLAVNIGLVQKLTAIAREMNITAPQLALAWVLANGDDLIPIPGTKKKHYLEENLAALDIVLPEDVKARLDEMFPIGTAAGERYPEHMMTLLDE